MVFLYDNNPHPWESPFTLLNTDNGPFISDKAMERLEKEREECVSLLASQKKEASELSDMVKALKISLPSPYSSWLTPSSTGYSPSSSSGYSPPSSTGNDGAQSEDCVAGEVSDDSPTKPKILTFGNRRRLNADHWIVLQSHQQKRLEDQSDQSWVSRAIQGEVDVHQCGAPRTGR